jgi:hypothetical protein
MSGVKMYLKYASMAWLENANRLKLVIETYAVVAVLVPHAHILRFGYLR